MENMAATVKAHGGIEVREEMVIAGSPWSGSHCLHATVEGGSTSRGSGDEMPGDSDVWTEPDEVCGELISGGLKSFCADGVQGVQDEQRPGGFVPQLRPAALAPVPAPAGHPVVVAPDDLT